VAPEADNRVVTKAGKNVGARVLLVIGFLAASLSYSCWLAERTVLDANETRGLARALLNTDAVQENLTDQAMKQLDTELPQARGNPQVRDAVTEALRDPRVVNAFADALGAIHGALLGKRQDRVTIGGHELSAAIQRALAKQNPTLAGELAKQRPLDIEFNGKDLPNFGNTRDNVRNLMTAAGMLAALLLCLSLFKAHDRRSISRCGRRIAYMAVVPLLVFIALPRVFTMFDGATPDIVGAALRAYAGQVLPSAIVLVVIGASVAIGAFAVPARRAVDPAPPPRPDAAAPLASRPPQPERQPLYM
jgi:hypothetical protein